MTVATLGIEVRSEQAAAAEKNLSLLTRAAQQAEAATDGLRAKSTGAASGLQSVSSAANAQSAAMQAAAAKVQAHTAALQANSAATARNSMMQRQLMYQMVDMGQALPLLLSGNIYGLQNMGFQIAQIGQLYYGQGGMGAALKDMTGMLGGALARIAPIAAAAGVAAAGLAGLTYEFNKTAETSVHMGDVALAAVQLVAEGIGSLLAPAINQVVGWMQSFWDWIAPSLKNVGNGIIGTFVGAFEAVKVTWDKLPAAIGDLVIQAANNVLYNVKFMIRGVQTEVNSFLGGIDQALQGAGLTPLGLRIEPIKLSGGLLDNPFAGSASELGASASKAFAGAQQDYLGAVGDIWSQRAQELARARAETDELGKAAKAANDNFRDMAAEGLQATIASLRDLHRFGSSVITGFVSDMKRGLQEGKNLWESLGNAAANALDKIADRFLSMAANGIWDMLFGSLFGGLLGSTSMTAGGSFFTPNAFVPGGFYPGMPGGGLLSFDGGGFTGYGPRSGGLDGKGGFPAILHPNETVIDHTRPANRNHHNDNSRGDLHIHINGSGLTEEQLGRAIANGIREYDEALAPKVEAKFRQMQSDPRAADGGW